MTRLPFLCLLVALAISDSLAAPKREVIEVAIGEPHEVPVPVNVKISGPIDYPLPSWMERIGDVLRMIAPPDALKNNYVVVGDLTLDIVVKDNLPTQCVPHDEWAEAVTDESLSHIWEVIKILESSQGISMNAIRVVPREYANAYRELTEEGDHSHKGNTVIIVKSDCGVAVAPLLETLYAEGYEQVSITRGSIPSRSARNEDANSILSSLADSSTDEPNGEELEIIKETTTLASTTTTRHTRATTAVAYVPIKSIQCKQGSYCEGELNEKTFLGGDGHIHTFNLTIEHLSGKGGVNPWIVKNGNKRSIGVIPLMAGEHTFRLKGIDKRNKQPVFAPFSITIQPDEPKNHEFKMTMHSLPSGPEHLRTTIVKLASFLNRNADEIKVVNVSTVEGSQKFVTYWNTSMPVTSCPVKEVAQWLRKLHIKHGEQTTNEFAKAFTNDPTIHPARLEVRWLGKCESKDVAAEEEVKTAGGKVGSKKGEDPIAEETEQGSLSTLTTIVCILALLLLILIAILCCIACRRSKAHKSTVTEYMSKGSPVVFPDEVEDEHADIPASAPMLVKEERPPLRVSEHSNPLYKPPPPLASTAASPRPSAPSSHKLPPPYVPP